MSKASLSSKKASGKEEEEIVGDPVISTSDPFKRRRIDLKWSQRVSERSSQDHWYDSEPQSSMSEGKNDGGDDHTLKRTSTLVFCPRCKCEVKTSIDTKPANFIKLLVFALFLLGFLTFGFTWLFCSAILLVPGFKKVRHSCPKCGKDFGCFNI